jgi:hypothetical protein
MTSDDRLLRGGIAWERVLLITTLLAALVFSAAPSAQAQTLFRDASANLPGGTSGPGMDVAAADVDGDGDLDIVIPNEFAANLLILNNGEAVFTQPTARFNSQANDSEDVEVVDLDNDGDLEVVFVAEDNARHELYAGNGNGTFRDVSSLLPMSIANAVAVADLDGDSFLDLVIGNAGQDLILMNRGSGNLNATPLQRSFQNETAQRLPPETRTTQDVELVDVDRDGDLDIMCGNEDGNQLLINDGTGKFTDQTAQRLPVVATMETRKVTFADVDGDGDPDLFLSNVAFIPGKNPQNRLYLNNGNGVFTDVTGTSLPSNSTWALDGKFIDADRDGDLDLITAGFNGPARFLRNDGSGRFTDATAQVLPPLPSGANIGIEIADLNRDGFLDVYVVRRGQADLLLLAETPSAQALNLSTRGRVQTGEKVLIGGFIFTGSAPKRVLLRGIGPSLENAGVSGVLLDPELQLRAADGSLLASNDNWRDTQEDQIAATGLSPDHSAESAVLATLTSGATPRFYRARAARRASVSLKYMISTGTKASCGISARAVRSRAGTTS